MELSSCMEDDEIIKKLDAFNDKVSFINSILKTRVIKCFYKSEDVQSKN